MPTDAETLAEIRAVVADTDEHRNRAVRESWAEIKAIIGPRNADDKPPTAGPHSTVAAWLAYAEAHGVEVPSGASRGDIIAAVEAAESAPVAPPTPAPAPSVMPPASPALPED